MAENTTKWLDPHQQLTWRNWLRATDMITSYLDAELRQFGLDLAEYEILVTLSEVPTRRMRMSELADAARQSRSRLTHTVDRMQRKDLVARETCEVDGRGVWAALTESGYALLVRVAPHHVAAVRHVFVDAVGPEDFAALGRAMSQMVAVAD